MLLGKVLRLISRDEWLAQPPNNDLTDLVLPVKRYIITHTATESCETQVGFSQLLNKLNANCYVFRLPARSEFDSFKRTIWRVRIGTTSDTTSWLVETVQSTKLAAGTSRGHIPKVISAMILSASDLNIYVNFRLQLGQYRDRLHWNLQQKIAK